MSRIARRPPPSAAAEPLRLKAYRYIQSKIATGAYPAGEAISEAALSREIGVSRTPVREALGQLVAEGFLEQSPGRGIVVRRLTRADVIDLYELREALEVYAVAKVARAGLPPEDSAELEALCAKLPAMADGLECAGQQRLNAEQMRRFLGTDLRFHLLLLRAAGNRRIIKAAHDARVLLRVFSIGRLGHDAVQLRKIHAYHKGILDAVMAHDVERASQLASDHIRASCRERLEAFDYEERISTIRLEDTVLSALEDAAGEALL